MIWRLLPHLTACTVTGRVFLLDVRQDRYFALPDGLSGQVASWLGAPDRHPRPDGLVVLLTGTGVMRKEDGALVPGRCEQVAIPMSPPSDTRTVRLSMLDHARLARDVVGTWIQLRRMPLERILATHKARPPADDAWTDELAARARGFAKARRILPIRRNCLLDSLALDTWLGGSGGGRRLVMGVASHPFAAHCWLQTDSIVLNDSFDRVSRYTPVLAV